MSESVRLYSHGSDVVIAGAGVIGLSLALELRNRGAAVTIYDAGTAGAQASSAAAGMLAVHDPHNAPELFSFAELSWAKYPDFLRQIEALSGQAVPFQTEVTSQRLLDGKVKRLAESSVDPRQLLPALRRAVLARGVHLCESTEVPNERRDLRSTAAAVVHTTGAWASIPPVFPRKGQMLRVQVPPQSEMQVVYRAEHVYIVPRTRGPQAGTALIGATVENAGFDLSTNPESLRRLRLAAAELVPEIADEKAFCTLESWAGLRPATPDGLPLLGKIDSGHVTNGRAPVFIAGGHFRNGILLAPGTANVIADLLEGKEPAISLSPFSPARFAATVV